MPPGFFGIAEVARNLNHRFLRDEIAGLGRVWPSREDVRLAAPSVVRGTIVGCLLGVLPGGGALLGSFASYMLEKKITKQPQRFGKGAIEGVAGAESANNAGAQTSFIPMLTLGIPAKAVMAVLIGALNMHGITAGPSMISSHPDVFWGLLASMIIGNVILVVLNLPLIWVWVKLLKVPYRLLFPTTVVLCCIGVYTINNSAFDVVVMMICGSVGYILLKFDFQPPPSHGVRAGSDA